MTNTITLMVSLYGREEVAPCKTFSKNHLSEAFREQTRHGKGERYLKDAKAAASADSTWGEE
jgi:hypothetical protein